MSVMAAIVLVMPNKRMRRNVFQFFEEMQELYAYWEIGLL